MGNETRANLLFMKFFLGLFATLISISMLSS